MVKWFLLFVHGIKASIQLVFSWLFRIIFYNLVVIPEWSWEEVSVASTYSSTILNLPLQKGIVNNECWMLILEFG